MEFWVGVTDNDWYRFLANLQPDEVNFWQPSGTSPFKKWIELFLFKLHSPLNYIAGGGYFVTYTNLPISLAWENFGEKNGLSSYPEFKNTILSETSRPFDKPKSGRIAVKVINHLGDEVMKVFSVE